MKEKLTVSETCGTITEDLAFCVIRVPKGEERESSAEVVKETVAENFLNLAKVTNPHIQETELIPNRINTKAYTPRHITMKCLKTVDKENILKAAAEKQGITSGEKQVE